MIQLQKDATWPFQGAYQLFGSDCARKPAAVHSMVMATANRGKNLFILLQPYHFEA